MLRARLATLLHPVRRRVLAHRRLLAAVLTAVAVLGVVRGVHPPPPARTEVTVAARSLEAGTVLDDADLTTARFAPDTAPDGLAPAPLGRTLAGPVRRGEPVTETRLVGPALGGDGLTALPVRFPDTAMVGLLRVGDRIDVLATDPQGGEPRTVATAASVLALPATPGDVSVDGLPGRLVVLGAGSGEVAALADASVRLFLTFAYAR